MVVRKDKFQKRWDDSTTTNEQEETSNGFQARRGQSIPVRRPLTKILLVVRCSVWLLLAMSFCSLASQDLSPQGKRSVDLRNRRCSMRKFWS
ncbi:hypothetical protein NPIL_476331 [Nephila pilipes]|uniref:Uncharacterized protein n=1 Tax=Nephila pilipes TaxID=299642 RepID=A0A8X6PXF2_NEPPI|nr:hypothetical protein NPIL_476331 [Nephila pilipes]